MAFLMIVHVPVDDSRLIANGDVVGDVKELNDEKLALLNEEKSKAIADDQTESENIAKENEPHVSEAPGEIDDSSTEVDTQNDAETDSGSIKAEQIAENAKEAANIEEFKKETADKEVTDDLVVDAQETNNDLDNDKQIKPATVNDISEDANTKQETLEEDITVKLETEEMLADKDTNPDEIKGAVELKDDTDLTATEERTDEDGLKATVEIDDKKETTLTDTEKSSVENSPEKLEPMSPTTIKNLVPLVAKLPLYQEVENLLISEVDNLEKTRVGKGKFMRFSFIEDDSKQCENILNMLKVIGVGFKAETSVSIFPSSVHESGAGNLDSVSSEKSLEELQREESVQDANKENVFKKSIKSRLVVAQVISSVRGGATFTFDFLLLLLLASIISCVGLAESSSVVLVASMLISPLMGPILAGTFGQVVKMKDLRNLGLRSELLGLSLCVLVGFVIGLVTGGIGLHGAIWGSSDQWPTPEMKSRGMARSLWVGILIALPSGAGVAISVLSANAGSLVGVAISASLLPPACNAGMLWGYALLAAISPPEVVRSGMPISSLTTMVPASSVSTENVTLPYLAINSTNTTDIPQLIQQVTDDGSLVCPPLVHNAYTPVYSCNLAIDAVVLGSVSLLLTIVNIICIFLVGIVFLKIKEVAPHTAGKEKATDHFWHEDVKVARTYYETRKGVDSSLLGKQFLEEWKKIKGSAVESSTKNTRKDSMFEGAETLEMCQYLVGMQNSAELQNVLSKLNTPTSDLMDDLLPEFDKAKMRLQEEIVKHPGYVLSNTVLQSNDKKFMRAYHTLSAAAPDVEKPSLFELRKRFRKMGGVQSMFLETEDNATATASPYLSEPVESSLGQRRREKKAKMVKFDVQRVDEEQPLILS